VLKIATILGARPQFIKAAVVSRAIKDYNQPAKQDTDSICEVIIHSGQHYDLNMSDVFFEELDIPKPDFLLGVHNCSHGAMTGRMLEKFEVVLKQERPHLVLVYGDTNTTLAGALTAAKMHIPVAHVEAGLRSFNRRMAEEINRVLTDHVASILFCPTRQAVENLKREGIVNRQQNNSDTFNDLMPQVELTGDVMFDAALYYRKHARKLDFDLPERFILATVHRSENTDDPTRLTNIICGLEKAGKKIPVVVPLHPRTRKCMDQFDLQPNPEQVWLIEPVGYLNMIYLLEHCSLVLTDSGGLQKEAYFFRKPCVTFREETEWVELVEHGFNRLVGADPDQIMQAVTEAVGIRVNFDQYLYGDGKAGEKIVNFLSALDLNPKS
jgi:UDP-GlcNAc3NAcA epimerase